MKYVYSTEYSIVCKVYNPVIQAQFQWLQQATDFSNSAPFVSSSNSKQVAFASLFSVVRDYFRYIGNEVSVFMLYGI